MSDRKFGCSEGKRARVRTRRSDNGDFGMRLEGEMRERLGDFGEVGRRILVIRRREGSLRRSEGFGWSDGGR